MTPEARLDAVTRAIRATLEGDSTVVAELFAPDVHASMPATVWSAPGLAVEIEDRAGVFDDVELRVTCRCDQEDDVWVEWAASVRHVGPFALEDLVLPPTGRRTALHGVTVAEFADDRIVGFRQYWDHTALMDGDASCRPRRGRQQRG